MAAIALSGCAVSLRAPVTGFVFTKTSTAEIATDRSAVKQTGRACASSILGLLAMGDASINAAATAGNVREISYVDSDQMSVLGVFARYCTIVYGS